MRSLVRTMSTKRVAYAMIAILFVEPMCEAKGGRHLALLVEIVPRSSGLAGGLVLGLGKWRSGR